MGSRVIDSEEGEQHIAVQLHRFKSGVKVAFDIVIAELGQRPKSLLSWHDHQESGGQRSLSLAVADFGFDDGQGFEDAEQVLLSGPVLLGEHFVGRELAMQVPADLLVYVLIPGRRVQLLEEAAFCGQAAVCTAQVQPGPTPH